MRKDRKKMAERLLAGVAALMVLLGAIGLQAEAETNEPDRAAEIVSSMSLEEKIAQMFIVRPETISDADPVTSWSDLRSYLGTYSIGGIVMFSKNLVDPSQTIAMNEGLQTVAATTFHGLPLFLCVDEEGGRVARIASNSAFGVDLVPSMQELASSGEDAVYAAASQIGSYLKYYGFNVDFAPDADVLVNPENQVIGDRSFGSDPGTVAALAAAYERGLKSAGVEGCYKHFPGHGNTAGDSHLGYVYTDKDVYGILPEILPFHQGAIEGVNFIMAGHIAAPNMTGDDLPASLSKTMITGILRDQIGYEGIVVTDAMDMGAITERFGTGESAVMAVEAGCDMILSPADFLESYNAVLSAVQSGRISTERIDESVRRIVRVKLSLQ